ncbi:hypothetical protein PENSPDRAFT_747853 [Peniophora sp. CONT]|nr:hypothetical protein PENSPDRAFT_747853 [Peniophora sp. CONT]
MEASMTFEQALAHEDEEGHTAHVRRLQQRSREGEVARSSPRPGDMPSTPPARPGPQMSSPLPPSSPPPFDASDDESLPLHAAVGIHGPAQPSDRANEIYDNYAGNLGARSSSPPQPTTPSHDPPLSPHVMDALYAIANGVVGSHARAREGEHEEGRDSDHDSVSEYDLDDDDLPEPAIMEDPVQDAADWWPWRNKRECLMDLFGAFPRAVFSDDELEIVRWFAQKFSHGEKIPSARSLRRRRKAILRLAGSRPHDVVGTHKNHYTCTDLATLIQHELANPIVRPHLSSLPKESAQGNAGEHLSAHYGERWACEVESNLACPMVRSVPLRMDFYVAEPALRTNPYTRCLEPIWPVRWFERDGIVFARAHPMFTSDDNGKLWIEADELLDVPLSEFELDFTHLLTAHALYSLPSPTAVAGMYSLSTQEVTKPNISESLPNPLRTLARGRRIISLPIWLYCDDTSGNTSKKWNKHNSFLFTLAGLDPDFALRPSNIHFLATSNIAPPLEMLQEIVRQVKALRESGIAAWDCKTNEEVLVLPWILAFLGDNPMQSEFTSHVGLTGKLFCRMCKVMNSSDNTAESQARRFASFMKPGTERTLNETKAALRTQFDGVCQGFTSKLSAQATEHGVKDKHFNVLYEEFVAAAKKLRDANTSQGRGRDEGVAELFTKLRRGRSFEELMNPILSMADFNPHTDTPVEILHVVLLGIIKYFWRDAVSRQTSEGKATLRARLRSLDPRSLGLSSSLQANVLVNYAGSLTGRDFRIIAQVAPIVLYDLVPPQVYKAWLCVGRLTPLAFQHRITNLTEYLAKLENAIDALLLAALDWNIEWFNKPKFHILIHLPAHIRRFGPATLTATEGFESHNAVIRKRSVHSTRQAPSEEIAQSMSFMHAARHLVCGGWVEAPEGRRTAGPEVRALMNDRVFARLMGLSHNSTESDSAQVAQRHVHHCRFEQTITSTLLARRSQPAGLTQSSNVQIVPHMELVNGDRLYTSAFILFRRADEDVLALGRVREISVCAAHVFLSVERWTPDAQTCAPYDMPCISPQVAEPANIAISYKDAVCVVHTFHNCARRDCRQTSTRVRWQERQLTELRDDEFKHESFPNDLVLNLAQIRSAHFVQTLRQLAPVPQTEAEHTAMVWAAVMAHRAGTQVQRPPGQKAKKRKAEGGEDSAAKRSRTGESHDWTLQRTRLTPGFDR